MLPDDLQRSLSTSPTPLSAGEIGHSIVNDLAAELQVAPEKIRVDQPILACGIDSIQVVSVVAKLEDRVGIRFPANPLDDYPTVQTLAQYAAGLAAGSSQARPD